MGDQTKKPMTPVEHAYRAGFLAGCSYGMDQASDDRMRHHDHPDVDDAWAEFIPLQTEIKEDDHG